MCSQVKIKSEVNNNINIYKFDKRRSRHSVNHIACLKDITLFGKNTRIEFSLSSQLKQSIGKHNEAVKQNRKLVGQLIIAVCFLGFRGLALWGHDENWASVNRGNYIEVLNILACYDSDLHNHLESSTVFCGSSPDIQNELIQSISISIYIINDNGNQKGNFKGKFCFFTSL
jgi:hypothetical protein